MASTLTNTTQVNIQGPAASASHPNHGLLVLNAILAAIQAGIPVIINLLPPAAQVGLEVGDAALVTTVTAINAAEASKTPAQ